ncbi:MAG: hypothetical protein KAW12_08440 [Candidatus Aminicenantes bacterium]|nr:hypothetical protein [Candidatus Aminicenantes bacterium]
MGLQTVESEKISFYARKILKKIESNFKIIPLNSLREDKYFLKYPLYITIEHEHEKGNVIASFDDVEAFAYSDNEFEAVDLLCREIIVLYEDLLENQENLGPLPQKWFSILQGFIRCN